MQKSMEKILKRLKKKVKLIVLDLDGTALGGRIPYIQIPPKLCKVLDFLSGEGILWSINTTWDIKGQWNLVLLSPIKSRPVFFIGEMGRTIARFDKSEEPEIIEEYTSKMDKRVKKDTSKIWKIISILLANNTNPSRFLLWGHLNHFGFDKDEDKESALELLKDSGALSGFKLYQKPTSFNLVPSYLGKEKALQFMQKLLNISSSNTLVAGDEDIDISMMKEKIAKYVICPANSTDKVKSYVKRRMGIISEYEYSEGVIDGLYKIALQS